MKNELQPSAAHFLLYNRMCGLHTHSTTSGIQYKSYQRFP